MKKKLLTIILMGVCLFGYSQTTDLARVEYMYIPQANSDNSITRFRALAQLPIPLDKDKDKIIVVGMGYRNTGLTIQDPVPFETSALDHLHRIEGYLGYVFKISDNWRLGAKAGARINSNLEGKLVSDDVIYETSVYAINDMKKAGVDKPYRWIFGLTYSTTPGRNYPLPLVNYYREFHPDWTYTLGVPKSNIRHYLKASHKDALQAFASLDNFFSNIQNNIEVNGKTAENVSMTIIMAGLGYEHYFTDHLLYYMYATRSLSNDYRLRDNERNDIYTFNDKNTFYFRSGVKFKF